MTAAPARLTCKEEAALLLYGTGTDPVTIAAVAAALRARQVAGRREASWAAVDHGDVVARIAALPEVP